MNNPLVSICIPAYNVALFINETIECWINQTYQNIEIIIQDDSSKDDTYHIALELAQKDKRIKVFQNAKNLGIGGNWNECYEKASGEFVVIFNADDTIEPDFLFLSLETLKLYPNLDLVFHNYKRSFETDEYKLFATFTGLTQDLISIENQHPKRIHWNYTLVKKSSLNLLKTKYGLFYPTQVCDAMLWFAAYKNGFKGYYFNKPVGIYRDHENNNSKIKFGEFESTFLWMIPIYPNIFNEIHPKSINNGLKMIMNYLYNCFKYHHLPNHKVIKNLITFRI